MAIRRLEEKHRQLAEEILKGTTRTKIAEKLGVTRSTIYEWMKDELWQTYFDKLLGEVEAARRQRLLPVAMKAAELAEYGLDRATQQVIDKDADAPNLQTIVAALRVVIELERVDRGQPSSIKRTETTGDTPTAELSPQARRLLDNLDAMVKAEDEAGGHLVDTDTDDEGKPH